MPSSEPCSWCRVSLPKKLVRGLTDSELAKPPRVTTLRDDLKNNQTILQKNVFAINAETNVVFMPVCLF